jgi:hypothetical protein
MDIPYLLIHILQRAQVSVVTAASLPKAIIGIAIWLGVLHLFEEVRCIGPYPKNGPLGDRGFDCRQYRADLDTLLGQEDKMYVVRHENKTPQVIHSAVSAVLY